MKSNYDIIMKPIVSEKSMASMQDKTYAFKVACSPVRPGTS